MSFATARLSEVAEVAAGGGAPQNSGAFTPHGSPFVRAGSLNALVNGAPENTLEHLTGEIAKEHGLRRFPPNTVVFAKSGMSAAKGLVYRLRNDAYLVNHLAALIPNQRVDSGFLEHSLRVFSATRLIQDAGYPSIRLSDVAAMQIPLPPLAEQRRIAEVLDRAEALRAKRRAALAQLDTLTQAVFLAMFGPGGTHRSQCTEWALGSLCRRITDGVHKTPRYVAAGVPFATVKNITSGTLDLAGAKFISYEDHVAFTGRTKPERGDLLVSKDGTIGVPCSVDTEVEFSIFVSVALLKPNFQLTDTSFLKAQFLSDDVQRQIRAGSKGIAIRHLHLEDFRRLVFLVPPLGLQQDFARRVAAVETLKAVYRASLAELNALFAALQDRAFRGHL